MKELQRDPSIPFQRKLKLINEMTQEKIKKRQAGAGMVSDD